MSGYGEFARYYDTLTYNVNYKARAAYFDELVRRHGEHLRGGLLLDLACGTGSLSLAFAGLGYEVIGVDASAEMLSEAMRKTAEAECRLLLLHQSMQELDLYGTVGVTVCALDSLNHLHDEAAVAAVFSRVSLFTEPGGLFLFDVNTAYKHREVLADNAYIYERGDVFCCWQNTWNPGDGSVDIALDFFIRDTDKRYRRSRERFTEHLYARDTLERLLREHGMEPVACYGDDRFDEPGKATQREIYVARKTQG